MTGAAGYMALVLAEAVAGSLAFLWCVPLWNEVKRGFFTLTSSILLVLAVAAWWSTKVALVPGDAAGLWSVRLALATAVVVGVTFLLMLAKRQTVARVVGLLSVPGSIAVLVAMASTGRQGYALSLFQLLAGAAFLGTILDGLLLGHWYLVDRRLSNRPIAALATWLFAGVAAALVSAALGGARGSAVDQSLSPLLAFPNLTVYLAVGLVLVCGLMASFIRVLVKENSIQAATGMFYLAVIMALAAEFAAKVYFFPS